MPKIRRTAVQIEQAERAKQTRIAFEEALLSDLRSEDPAAKRAAMKIFIDRITEKYDELQAELETLKRAAGETVPRAELEAAVTAKSAVEEELKALKDSIKTALPDYLR